MTPSSSRAQAKRWVYLYIDDDVVELRDAADLKGLDTWDTQNALSQKLGLSGHALSVYSIGPAGENLVRFAAIQGDYGHVASKNGVGAVMGKKRVKAVAIVKGTKGLRAADPRGRHAGGGRHRPRSQDGPVRAFTLRVRNVARRGRTCPRWAPCPSRTTRPTSPWAST